ncbi:MAG: RelA/SpoT domain-containing protein [Campylobacteraceae bacterium]|nr:RelA/SpoT domain-containing protein [Campylobacteraceae bacterium]
MDKNKLSLEFHKLKGEYNKLGQNLVEALKIFLNDNDIPFLDIYYRVKKFDSFYQKLKKKKYHNPFEDTEDLCGLRIICYYTSDIEKINLIINDEFNVLEEQDKSDLLGLKEFAYRSKH